MCGIAGIINRSNSQPLRQAIEAMTSRIAHRGPDAQGIYVDERIALGHRRLSIIDLSESANQPMWDFSKRFVIVYNGEIYNYREVKSLLPDYPFHTQSDSEVILAAYSRWGHLCLDKLNGMFAFAIWDSALNELFIARDRLGKKPLYYFNDAETFVFSSEIRSLLSSGVIPRKTDEAVLNEFLMFQAPMGPNTLIQNVKQLKAGNYAIVKNGVIDEKPYWNYASTASEDNYETARKKVSELFLDSVRLRMISDVPIGAFLSGGIDSSLVVACMAELSENPVNTFNISFHDEEYDESRYADIIAKKYNTNHHRIVIEPEEFLYSLEEIFSAMDSPSGDGPNTYLVAKQTRQAGIKVALSGLGGDELFAGYHKFFLYGKIMRNRWITKAPFGLRKAISHVFTGNSSNGRNLKKASLLELKNWTLSTVYPELRCSYSSRDAASLLSGHAQPGWLHDRLEAIEISLNGMENMSKATIGELETYTRDVLLRDTDQMAMAHALEVRVPFFDYRLVEYVLSLPDKYKIGTTPKKLLTEAMSSRLPGNIIHRKKMGFTFPFEKWLRKELNDFASERIQSLSERQEFNGDEVRNTWNRFLKNDQKISWAKVWQLVVLGDWLRRNDL